MSWNDHVNFEMEDRIEWIIGERFIDDRPEYNFLREIAAKNLHILERECYRDPGYQAALGVTALSEEQWRLVDALLDDEEIGAAYRDEFGCEYCSYDEGERICNGVCMPPTEEEREQEEVEREVG